MKIDIPHGFRSALTLVQTAFLVGCLMLPLLCCAQLRLAANVAPAVQNLNIAEATLTNGYTPRLMPQAGILASYGFAKGFAARLALRYDEHGFQLDAKPVLDHPYDHYWEKHRIDFAKAAVGIGYGGAISKRLVLGAAVDLVCGMPVRARNKIVEDGKVLGKFKSYTDFFNNYLGLELGLSLQYMLPSSISLGLSPTFQTQINEALASDIFIYRFVGFAPRIEIGFPLSKQH